jgi:hypothetical protein
MKTKKILAYISKIYGIIITALMVVVFVPKIFSSKGLEGMPGAFIHWYDDPTGFFFTYLIGYILLWWKPLVGSVFIMLGCLLFFLCNPNNTGFLVIFFPPTIMVAFFYILYWSLKTKKTKDA